MRLGLTAYALISLLVLYIITQHRTSADMGETLEEGSEFRENKEEDSENGASNGGAVGWRRRRNVIGTLNE